MKVLVEYGYLTENQRDPPVERFFWIEIDDQLTKEQVEAIINQAHTDASVNLPYLDFNEFYEKGVTDSGGFMGENDDVMVSIVCTENDIGSVAQMVEHEGEVLGVGVSKAPRSTNTQEEYLKNIIKKQQDEITFLRSILREMDTGVAVLTDKVRKWDETFED